MYLPENFPLYAEAFFIVGSGEPAWFNENGALGISLEYFGDEYNYIVSYLIHEFYSWRKIIYKSRYMNSYLADRI